MRRRGAERLGTVLVGVALLTGVVVAAAGGSVVSVPRSPGASPITVEVGHLRLDDCGDRAQPTFCATVAVPLDYAHASQSPTIPIRLHWLPHRGGGAAAGTILAVEGGPGYASTGSQAAYVAQLGPLRETRNLLLIDLRGTGRSGAISCPRLERYADLQHQDGPRFNGLVAACGRSLNHRWRYRDGSWVHASDRFDTADSARDVATVLSRLGLGGAHSPVDLYGDSYGSWFAQVFASRYPGRLRSVTLDSTYQVLGLDPWYSTSAVVARRAFNHVCAAWQPCRATARSRAWNVITALAHRLTRHPVSGLSTGPDGRPQRIQVSEETLVNLVNNAGFEDDPVVYRDLVAAADALLESGDRVPLLRLAALSIGVDDAAQVPPEYNDGLYFAVACTDYPQLFSRTASPRQRLLQYRAAMAAEPARTFAPFTVTQWLAMDEYNEAYSACLDWPRLTRVVAPITRRPPLVPRRLPVLVIDGTLDSLTPILHGDSIVAQQMGPSARLVRTANLTHVSAEDDSACADDIFQRFIRHPHELPRLDITCAAAIPPIHAVPGYARDIDAITPARAGPQNTAGPAGLREAADAVDAVGDEISREPLLLGRYDRGLRGGSVAFAQPDTVVHVRLNHVVWARGATISGSADWNPVSDRVEAQLRVTASGQPVLGLHAAWSTSRAQCATIRGTAAATRLIATLAAP